MSSPKTTKPAPEQSAATRPEPPRKPAGAIQVGESTQGVGARAARALALRAPTGMLPAVHQELLAHVEMVAEAGLMPAHVKTPEQGVVILLKGRELGMQPMQALASIYVVKGLPTLKTEAMLALAFQRVPGLSIEVVQSTPEIADVVLRRPVAGGGASVFRSRFSMEDAKRAGLAGKDAWRAWPMDMLRWRAIAPALRLVAPDVMQGTYTLEELDGIVPDVPASAMEDLPPVSASSEPTATAAPRVVVAEPVKPEPAKPEPKSGKPPPPRKGGEGAPLVERLGEAFRLLTDAVASAGLHPQAKSPEEAAQRFFLEVTRTKLGERSRPAIEGKASDADVAALLADLGRVRAEALKRAPKRQPGDDDLADDGSSLPM